MHTPVRAERRRSAAAKCFHLFGELGATLGPVLLFLALGIDDVSRRAAGEAVVLQARGKGSELLLELLELGAQLSALLGHIDEPAQRNRKLAPVRKDGMSRARSGGVVANRHR